MRRTIEALALAALLAAAAHAPLAAQPRDTIHVSDRYTTHLVFSSEINYADLSNQKVITAKIIDVSKNKLAIKARSPFTSTASLSVEEANGTFHTYIVAYAATPSSLLLDMRPGAEDVGRTDMLDVIEVSDIYTTHVIFATDINYADISSPSSLMGKLVDQGRNKLALKARAPFEGTANISVEEANGVFHTYLLRYAANPAVLVLDTRDRTLARRHEADSSASVLYGSREKEAGVSATRRGVPANELKRADAPLLSEVVEKRQSLHHIGVRNYRLTLMCENIYSYSDITYLVFSLRNNSGISYETGDATFILESNNGSRRKVVYESNVFPKNKFGKLTTAPYSESRIAYSFDKITLSRDQVIKVYVYEKNGSRNLVLTLTDKDINGAVSPFD